MELINKLLYRRFSKDEYKQLRKILSEEVKIFRKRPQFIVGLILISGIMFYFIIRAVMPATFQWPKTSDIVGVVVGAAVGAFVGGWVKLKLSKVKGPFPKFFSVFMFFWMVPSMLMIIQPSSQTKWEYLIYSVLILLGWMCCCESIKEHFCEKIFMSQKKRENTNPD